jgi:hypothetical protein
MRAEEIKGLMEAYSHVYETPEVLSEEVVEDLEVLDEAPMTAFQAGGGQAKLDKLNKGRSPRAGKLTARNIEATGRENLYKAGGGDAAIAKGPTRSQNVRGGGSKQVPTLTRQDVINRGASAAGGGKPSTPPATPPATGGGGGGGGGGTPSVPKPTTPTAAPKPAATSAPKPAAKPMDTWAKANPKLAAAAAEKARVRGTSQTDNPLMRGMKSKMSMTPSVQSSDVAKLGKGNQSLTGNTSAAKAATPKPATTPKPQAGANNATMKTASTNLSGSGALAPKPAAAAPKPMGSKKPGSIVSDLDLFDIIKGYLLDEGYAETEESAIVIMANMSEEWRDTILSNI